MAGILQKKLERIAAWPGVRQIRQARFDKRFENGDALGCFRGVFPTYADAARAAPATRPLGYDHEDAAAMYRDRLDTVYPADYAPMLWLRRAFDSGVRRVFDLGGHIGIAYYAYQRHVDYPAGLEWVVHDMPAVMRAGRQESGARDPQQRLSFADTVAEASGADLLFTSGCLQYLEQTLGQQVGPLARKPRWIVVNLLPLHDTESYWTVQSIGTAFCPYRIQHRRQFFAELEALGYQVLDTWENLEKECWIAFDPAHSLDRYHGAVLRLRD